MRRCAWSAVAGSVLADDRVMAGANRLMGQDKMVAASDRTMVNGGLLVYELCRGLSGDVRPISQSI